MNREKLPLPPSDVTGALGEWALKVWRVVNQMPTMSAFSGDSPNSSVTGVPGDFAYNVGSASTDSRLWIKGGSVAEPSRTGWNVVRIG